MEHQSSVAASPVGQELRVQAKRLEERLKGPRAANQIEDCHHQLREEREQCRAAMEAAEKKLAETEEFLRTFKQQTKIALNDYGDIQYREATLKSDFNSLQVQCKEKDHLIGDLRDQTVALTHETHVLEEKLIKVEREMERRTADAARLPELYEKLEYFEAEEAVHGVAFARRVAQEVLGKSLEDLAGRLPERMAMEKKTKVTLEAVLQTLLTAMRDREKSKEQVLKTHSLLEEVKQLVPIWNESSMQDLLDAYDEDSAVHRQVYSMNDKRSFAGLGLDTSVPPYLRAEGFVKHRYMSKKECEDIMESFFFEAPSDMHFFTLHQELHQSLQRRFKDPEEFTEFAYAFICSLEAYRDDPDFELFDLMLAGAVHPSIMQDQKNLLRELQGLVHNCADGATRPPVGTPWEPVLLCLLAKDMEEMHQRLQKEARPHPYARKLIEGYLNKVSFLRSEEGVQTVFSL
ncbi:Putative ammonium transporter (Fragment) [Durusdinium trenchii]|uniref:Ammonium transporter n=1 Tax=Durusdinium trenchii TaxID=1381693 RepID=A0ABP0QTC9_9DINO